MSGAEHSFDAFASRLLAEGFNGNDSFVTSPASLQVALLALAKGASGETYAEINSVLGGADARKEAVEALFSNECDYALENYAFQIGTSVWMEEECGSAKDEFVKSLEEVNGEVFKASFGSEEAKEKMSEWLSKATAGKFKQAPEVPEGTLMALIAAMNFKDNWVNSLDDAEELMMTFHTPKQDLEVEMMTGLSNSNAFYESEKSIAVSWDLESGASFVFAMPKTNTEINDFVASGDAWEAISNCYKEQDVTYPEGGVELVVPQFELKTQGLDLNKLITSLGVKRAFSPEAEFGKITDFPLMLDQVIQNSVLKLDPFGVEGAAYTMCIAIAGCPPSVFQEPVRVVFDRPFAFALFSNTGAPLSVGVYAG